MHTDRCGLPLLSCHFWVLQLCPGATVCSHELSVPLPTEWQGKRERPFVTTDSFLSHFQLLCSDLLQVVVHLQTFCLHVG